MKTSFLLHVTILATLVFSRPIFVPDSVTQASGMQPAVVPLLPNAPDLRDSAVFFHLLQQAFQEKNATLLSDLMDNNVRTGYLGKAPACCMGDGCPKAEVIRAAFYGPDAPGWKKFAVVWRMGFGRQQGKTGDYWLGPSYPGLSGVEQREVAYIFADDVMIRERPDKTAKALAKKSRCWVKVDTNELCYDDVPEDWLPVILDDGHEAYVYIHLTSWSKSNGFIIVKKDTSGRFRVVQMDYYYELPGTWYLPGCC